MKNELKFRGVVKTIYPIQNIEKRDGSKTYLKQEIVLEEDEGSYPNSIVLEVFDKLEKLKGVEVGDTVEAVFNTRVNEWMKDGVAKAQGVNSIWKLDLLVKGTFKSEMLPVTVQEEPPLDDLPF